MFFYWSSMLVRQDDILLDQYFVFELFHISSMCPFNIGRWLFWLKNHNTAHWLSISSKEGKDSEASFGSRRHLLCPCSFFSDIFGVSYEAYPSFELTISCVDIPWLSKNSIIHSYFMNSRRILFVQLVIYVHHGYIDKCHMTFLFINVS